MATARSRAAALLTTCSYSSSAAAFTAARADLGGVQLVINLYPYQGETAGSTLDAPPE